MNRDEQRSLGALIVGARRAVDEGLSTLPGTIHATSVQIEHVLLEGGSLLRDHTPAERRQLAREGRAMPDGSFPITSCIEADYALRSLNRASKAMRPAVESFIRRRLTALRCSETN